MPILEKPKSQSPILRGRSSNQDVGTPKAFLRVVQRIFGPIVFDLAASDRNRALKSRSCYFTPEDDALSPDTVWPRHRRRKHPEITEDNPYLNWNWLNPEFANIYPWAARTQYEAENRRVDTLFHVPASVDTHWWAEYLEGKAWWISLKGRLIYRGAKQGYPRPIIQAIFSDHWRPHDGLRELGFLGYSGDNANRPWPTTPSYLGQLDWKHVIEIISKEREDGPDDAA